MAREIIDIPTRLLQMMTFDWAIDWRGKRNSGATQTGISQMPRWVGAPRFSLHRAEIAEWRAIETHVEGLAGMMRIEMIDVVAYSARAQNPTLWERGIPFSDGSYFSDGTGWRWSPFVIAQADIPAGAPEMIVQIEPGAPAPRMGQVMSYRDWPFSVSAVEALGADQFKLWVKRLAVEIPEGGLIDLRPTLLAEKIDGKSGNPEYGFRQISRPRLELQEVLNR